VGALIVLPLRIESEANAREHWAKKAKRVKQHREAAYWHCKAGDMPRFMFPLTVRVTRIAPRELDDDNLSGGCKALRDGVADYLGIKDNDPRVTWAYAQRKGEPKQYAVEISFT
jgi:hypothetical protein